MTPLGRLRKAVALLDAVDQWNDKTERLPLKVRDTLHVARGLVAVTCRDVTPRRGRIRKAIS